MLCEVKSVYATLVLVRSG